MKARNGMLYTSIVIQSGEKHQSVQALRRQLVADMKHRGVKFEDIEKYLLNCFRKEGYFSTEKDLKQAKALDASWYHHFQLFLGWLDRHYSKKYTAKDTGPQTRDGAKKKKAEKKTVVRVATITEGKAKKLLDNPEALNILISALRGAGYKVEKEV